MSHIVRANEFVPKGRVFVMANYEHPETPMFEFGWGHDGITTESAEVPDGRIIACHPEDEQRVRDALAVAQERPKWWENTQAIVRTIREVS